MVGIGNEDNEQVEGAVKAGNKSKGNCKWVNLQENECHWVLHISKLLGWLKPTKKHMFIFSQRI